MSIENIIGNEAAKLLVERMNENEIKILAQKALRDSEEFKSFNYWANFVMLD